MGFRAIFKHAPGGYPTAPAPSTFHGPRRPAVPAHPRPRTPVTTANRRLRTLAGCCALSLLAVLPACGGGDGITPPPPPPPAPLTITVSGRLERGSAVTLAVTKAGVAVTPTLTFSPADGAQVLADGSVKLLR